MIWVGPAAAPEIVSAGPFHPPKLAFATANATWLVISVRLPSTSTSVAVYGWVTAAPSVIVTLRSGGEISIVATGGLFSSPLRPGRPPPLVYPRTKQPTGPHHARAPSKRTP